MGYIGAAYLVAIDDPITDITAIRNASLKVGRDTHNLVDFSTDDTIILRVGNANEVELTPTALYPTTRDGVSLGTTDKEWSDLFLADSSVIVMGEGNDVTVTHDGTTGVTIAANPITIDSGGDITLDADGGDVFFKDGGTTFGSATNTSGNLIIKSGTTTAATFAGANVTFAGEVAAVSLDISGAIDVDGTTNLDAVDIDGAISVGNTLTVGVDDTGHDVKFFGASAGAYMEWDESADQLRIMGASADATTSTGKLLLATSLTDINANDVIGKIDFQAPHEAGGTDAIAIAASIQAIAQGTFSASVNATDLIFYTGNSEAATEKFRFTSQGELGIGGANYGSSGQILTSGGAGAAPSWATASSGGVGIGIVLALG